MWNFSGVVIFYLRLHAIIFMMVGIFTFKIPFVDILGYHAEDSSSIPYTKFIFV